jgi:hypothetical protein
MIIITYTGLCIILISVIMNLIEVRRFLKVLSITNKHTNTFKGKIYYIPRLIKNLYLLAPIIPDIIGYIAGAAVGLGQGFYAFILTAGGTCFLTMGLKFMLWLNRCRTTEPITYEEEIATLKQGWQS